LLTPAMLVDAWTTSADVEATRPEPDLTRAGGDPSAAGGVTGEIPWRKRV